MWRGILKIVKIIVFAVWVSLMLWVFLIYETPQVGYRFNKRAILNGCESIHPSYRFNKRLIVLDNFKIDKTKEEVIEEEEEIIVEEPIIEEPIVEEPIVEEPIIEEPIVEEPIVEQPPSNIEWYTIEVSFYCACYQCCGKTDGITASGDYATEGVTVALPSSIPLGTHIVIDGHEYICQDRGGAIIDYGSNFIRADIYLDSHEECMQRGRYYTEGYIIW
jgi:3D (Asp-Asp-Asp) domain-containing protein